MTAVRLVTKLLKFKGFIAVSFGWERWNREFVVFVKPHRNGARCPECGRRGKIVRSLKPRRWRDGRLCGQTVWFVYSPREIRCRKHGQAVEVIPWAAPFSRMTYRFEYTMLRLCSEMTQQAVANLLGLATSTLSDLLHRSIQRGREGHKIRGLKTIGIDEISYAKGHKYATVVYDLDRSCVVWIGAGKGRETIDRFFSEALSNHQKAQIKWACCDMSEAYMGAIKAHCKNATLVLDRFHIVKKLNEAVDEVRKEQWRNASKKDRKALKGLRWLLYRHSSTRSPEATRTLKQLEKLNRRIYRAWRLKDEFEQFWEYKAPWAARQFLKSWTTTAMRSRLDSIKRFVRMIREHAEDIIAFVDTRLTNAVSEGLNRIIQIIKNRASGFRDLDPFSDMIYLVVGDVDIAGKIPARFRTL